MCDELLKSLQNAVRSEKCAGAGVEIRQAILARRRERGGHRDWALLCEQAGLMSLAFSEFQLALRDDPADAVAAFHLAQHYRERGDTGRALGLLERLLADEPARVEWLEAQVEILCEDGAEPRAREAIARAAEHGLASDQAVRLGRLVTRAAQPKAAETRRPDETELVPTDADCVRFYTLFAGREGVYARQWVRPNGETGYSPVREPLTPAVVRNHLLGTYTIGVYPVRLDATATFFALDLDIDKAALKRARGDHRFAQSLRETLASEGPRLLGVLRDLGFQPLFENSGYKGRHYWVFLQQPETADVLHLMGRMLLAWQSPQLPPGLHLEFFPKQARLKGKGLGNLIKLPLGIHRRTGYRSRILDDRGQPVPDPLAALGEVQRAAQATLHAAIDRLKTLGFVVPPSGGLEEPAEAGTTSGLEEPAKAGTTGGLEEPAKAGTTSGLEEPAEAGTTSVAAPPPPPPAPVWTEADFQADPRVRHLLEHCPALAALKNTVDEHRRLSHEEQLVLIHSMGHLEGGPQAVNYLFAQCVDVGPEKFMKGRLKGNPVSCPSIRKKIPHITRRVACNCAFEFAADRYPTPVLYLLTLPADQTLPTSAPEADPGLEQLARRFGVLERRRAEIQHEWEQLHEALVEALRARPDRVIAVQEGRYRLLEREGVEELVWEADDSS